MKKFLKGVKKFMREKIEAAKDVISNPLNRFIIGSTAIGFGVAMVATCFIPKFN